MGFQVFLFGKFRIRCDQEDLTPLEVGKAQELLSYLVLYRGRSHPRETLAQLLWERNTTTAQSRKLLRQTLWQLQSALDASKTAAAANILLLEPDWVGLNPQSDLWSDVAAFELAFERARETPAQALDAAGVQALQEAVQLYQGDLLEGWYQDWCLYERERLENIYLMMLEKLMIYSEAHSNYEPGLAYGARILRCDPAHEPTHRRLMRLHYLAGNRAAALRQYQHCTAALEKELSVGPDKNTQALHRQILADQLDHPQLTADNEQRLPARDNPLLSQVLQQLGQIQTTLADIQQRLQREI